MRSAQNFDVFPTKRKNRKPANRHKSCEIDYKSELNESEINLVSPRKLSSHKKKNQVGVFKEHADGKVGIDAGKFNFSEDSLKINLCLNLIKVLKFAVSRKTTIFTMFNNFLLC